MYKYCSFCGSSDLVYQVPEFDNRQRCCCISCGMVHYSNPKVIVGAVVTFQGKYLLCKRNIAPRLGYWTYPAGYLENGESVEEGARREVYEESKAQVKITRLLGTYSLLAVDQVHLIYEAKMLTDTFAPTQESSEVRLYSKDEIPWSDLAFPVIKWALQAHLNAKKTQAVPVDSLSSDQAEE